MRDAKDIMKHSAFNMSAIFGVRVDSYYLDNTPPLPSHIDTKRKTTPTNGGDDGGAVADPKRGRGVRRETKTTVQAGALQILRIRGSVPPSSRGRGITPLNHQVCRVSPKTP